MNTQSLIDSVDPLELTVFAPALTAWKYDMVGNEDQVAAFMYRGGPVSPQAALHSLETHDARPEKSYWQAVKKEMHLFLCTDDARYIALWQRIDSLESKSTTTVVGIIASALGSTIGVAATLVAGFVAVCLYGLAKLGKEAYCAYAAQVPGAAGSGAGPE